MEIHISFPESFSENMCKRGANVLGSFKKLAVFAKICIVFAKNFHETEKVRLFVRNFSQKLKYCLLCLSPIFASSAANARTLSSP